MAAADNYSSGGGGGNDWELVSLTASTYAAAPGPILPLLDDDKRESSPPAAIFMSGHFSLPSEADVDLIKQTLYSQEFSPAAMMGNDDTDLNMSCAKNCQRELDDGLPSSDFLDKHQKSVSTLDDVLFADGNGLRGLSLAGGEQTTMFCSPGFDTPPDAVGSVAISSGVAYLAANDQSKIPCGAWWKKTFSFLCNSAKESVTFRFIFVAATIVGLAILGQRDKLQLQQFGLQFNVDSEKISCSVGEPLGQVKGSMVVGGSQQIPAPRGN